MKACYGYENLDVIEKMIVIDKQEDLIITERTIPGISDSIPLLQITPAATTLLFDDFGFRSDSQKHYVYLELISGFFVHNGKEQEKEMFLLQVEEELIAVVDEEERIYIISEHNHQLVKKWASSYKIHIEFILF
jgi:hypothetical protein